MMQAGLVIEVVYADKDLVELSISADNGLFSGRTYVYVHHGAPQEIAERLKGFPRNTNDERNWEAGTFEPGHGGGSARGTFACTDGKGHLTAKVTLEYRDDEQRNGTMVLNIPAEPAAIDAFVSQLDGLTAEVGQSAVLKRAV